MGKIANEVLDYALEIMRHTKEEPFDEVMISFLEELKQYRDAEEQGLLAKVVHGAWEAYPSSLYRRCSVCKREFDKLINQFTGNYCPNCGAKMDGKEEGAV